MRFDEEEVEQSIMELFAALHLHRRLLDWQGIDMSLVYDDESGFDLIVYEDLDEDTFIVPIPHPLGEEYFKKFIAYTQIVPALDEGEYEDDDEDYDDD